MEKSELKEENVEKINKNEEIEKKEATQTEKNEKKENDKIEEQKTKYMESKKKKIIIFSTIGIVALITIIFSTIFALININNDKIISGVGIQGIDVSGLSQEEAKAKIEEIFNEKQKKDILLKYNEYETNVNPEVIETKYDLDKAVKEAISVGKNSNIIVNNYNILFALVAKKNIIVDMTINEETLKNNIEEMNIDLPGAVREPSYVIEEDKLIITKGQEGIKINTEDLTEKIKNSLNDINTNQEVIEIPVTNKVPEEIDIEKIHEEIYKEVQDAYYTKDPFTIHPEVEGVDFDVEEAKKILEEDKETYEIPLTITKPKVTTAQIGSEAFPDLLATFSTRYDGGQVDRTTNLRIACQKINDKVILPGETFSYNSTLGVRSQATGYKNAKVYENGEVVDGIGGGICQISSTLYNAILMANMDVVERKNHQFVTSYLPAGRDATVVYGMTDFKFKNTRTYAVRIKATCSNGVATVSIYGIKEENEYIVSFSTKTISSIPFTVKYVDDSTLAPGQEKIKQKGANGIITETYIIKSLNGKVVSSKLLSKDTYNAMQKIILRGVGNTPATVQNTQTNNNQQTTTPTPTPTPTQTETPTQQTPTQPTQTPTTSGEGGEGTSTTGE